MVAVCDVGRTVVQPAPLGAFPLHEFHSEWGSWIQYYTGRVVTIRRSGLPYWGSRCPNLRGTERGQLPQAGSRVDRAEPGNVRGPRGGLSQMVGLLFYRDDI